MAAEENFIKYSDLIRPDDSIEKLIALLEKVSEHTTGLSSVIPNSAEKIAAAIKKVTGVTTSGEAELAKIAGLVSKLEQGWEALAIAQSDFGKSITIVKEQIKDVNRDTVNQYRENTALKGSIDKLNMVLSRQYALYKNLSEAQRGGKIGKDVLNEIKALTKTLGESQLKIKTEIGAINDYIRAQVNLGKQQNKSAQDTARVADQTARLSRGHKLAAATANTNAKSLVGIKARLDELIYKYRNLDNTRSKSAQKMLERITKLTIKYAEQSAVVNENTLSTLALANASRREALSQSDTARIIAEKNVQTEKNNFLNKAQAQLIANVEIAEEKLRLARSAEAVVLEQNKQALDKQNQANKINAILKQKDIGLSVEARRDLKLTTLSYEALGAVYEANATALAQYNASQRENLKEAKDLQAQQVRIAALRTQMSKGIEASAEDLRSLGNGYNALGFSLAQIIREAPAAAVSMNTFFLAISNNIPMFADEVGKIVKRNKELKNSGEPVVSVAKQIGKALFSFNSVMMIAVTLLTFFGERLVKWTVRMIKGTNVTISHTKALRRLRKEIRATSSDMSKQYGEEITLLYRLQLQWKNLKTEAEKNLWIKNSRAEFSKLGVAINNINDAEKVFIKNTATMVEAFGRRALATAAEKLASQEFEKAIQEGTTLKALKEKEKERQERLEKIPEDIKKQAVGFQKMLAPMAAQGLFGYGYYKASELVASTLAPGIGEYLENSDKLLKISEELTKSEKIKQGYLENGVEFLKIAFGYEQDILDIYKKVGIKPETQQESLRGLSGTARSVEEYIRNMSTDIIKKANDALAASLDEGYEQRKKQIIANANKELADLKKTYKKNLDILNKEGIYKNVMLTPEQEEALLVANKLIGEKILEQEVKLEEAKGPIITDITTALNKKLEKEQLQHERDMLRIREEGLDLRLESVEKYSNEELEILKEKLEIEKQIALKENALRPKEEQLDPEAIKAAFATRGLQTEGEFRTGQLEQRLERKRAVEATKSITYRGEVDGERFKPRSAVDIQRFELELDLERWEEQLRLANAGSLKWSKEQKDTAKATIEGIQRQLDNLPKGFNKALAEIGQYGPGGALLHAMGLDDEFIDKMQSMVSTTMQFVNEILDAWVEETEKELELAKKRTEAAKSALDVEIEARKNGYANHVVSAQKELELQKQQEQKALLEKQKAQKAQLALDTITQASSLVTATAEIWSSMAGVPLVGYILAGIATAAMWGSFAIAKVKAIEAASKPEDYGKGGLEFLEGGSHASGNDIDLGVENHKHKRMHAEGGEALAIINKKRTQQYRDILPGLIESLNKGTFEQNYMRAFDTPISLQIAGINQNTDMSRLEREVTNIKNELGNKYYIDGNRTIIKKGNLTQVIIQ